MQFTFGKRLAAVEKNVRNEALSELQSQLAMETQLSKMDFLKLWKALFYNYWLADKPDVQLDLAEKLSLLCFDLSPAMGIQYIQYFWETIVKEWTGIDKFRLDKYYSLLRHMHFAAFKFIEFNDWNTELLSSLSQILSESPLNPTATSIPDGLRIHTLEVYLPILVATVSEIPDHAWPWLLKSMFTFASKTDRRHLLPNVQRFFKHEALATLQNNAELANRVVDELELLETYKSLPKKNRNAFTHIFRSLGLTSLDPVEVRGSVEN